MTIILQFRGAKFGIACMTIVLQFRGAKSI